MRIKIIKASKNERLNKLYPIGTVLNVFDIKQENGIFYYITDAVVDNQIVIVASYKCEVLDVDLRISMSDRDKVRPLVKVILHEDAKHYVVGYKCPNCNKLYMSDLDNFCSECGQKLREVNL